MTMLLVHGAWHGAWCWQGITPRLEAAGVNVIAPDLPGHGTDSTPRNQVTLDAYADRVIAAISGRSDRITLVGHSMGGVVISAVAERVPERIARLVYACAFLPRNGEALGQLATAWARRAQDCARPTQMVSGACAQGWARARTARALAIDRYKLLQA